MENADFLHMVRSYNIPVVKDYDVDSSKHPSYIVDLVRKAEDFEGVVICWEDGYRVKCKSEWYVRIHKVKSLLGQERDVVKLILNNELDDLLPVLPKEDVEKIEKFRDLLTERINKAAMSLSNVIHATVWKMDRKTFALDYAPKMNPVIRGMIFSFWDKEVDEHLTYQAIVAMILKHCGNNASYEKVKEAFLKDIDYV
jgi:hypothetical protein